MTTAQPHRLAMALINRLALDNEALAGDLLEEFRSGRSQLWLWSQLACAFARQTFYAPHPPVALNLTPIDPVVAEWLMEKRLYKRRTVHLTGTQVEGIGGLTMVILGFMVTSVIPAIWWFVLGGLVAGVVCGVAMVNIQKQVFRPLQPLKLFK
ncbi:MAG TPA: hypothetical protein VJ834_12945 [Burkholderiales bacterium]|nr:hypothetical protein [Burkholderiales bacterium]